MTDREKNVGTEGREEAIDEVLRAGFRAEAQRRPPDNILSAIHKHTGVGSRIVLRDIRESGSPVTRKPEDLQDAGRYQVLGEIARGGMGVVLEAMDPDLGRHVALKVLSNRHRHRPDIVQRFVEEARIGGQLQHPGIVPIYEMGLQPGDRPYFTMKLLQGQTLAALLDARRDPAEDRTRYLGIFHQVCQTVAYAHARGVIHRDLKPSNVMVGSFGEVQVIDWGLSKVMVRGGTSDDFKAGRNERQDRPVTVRAPENGSGSMSGSVLGTPAYMPPEQARGEMEHLDERSDVFALGAILCEILTGLPPYTGQSNESIRGKAAEADLEQARHRLESCDADEELVRIALWCLEREQRQRPRDAGVLAKEIGGFLESAELRVREAELEAAAAEVRAEQERKGRKLAWGLAVSVLVTMLVGGGAWWRIGALDKQRADELELVARFQASQLEEIEPETMGAGLRSGVLAQARAGMERRSLGEAEVSEQLRSLEHLLAGVSFTDLALQSLETNIFERALKAIDEQFADQPLVMARLLDATATTMHELGILEAATDPHKHAVAIRRAQLGDEHPDTLSSIHKLGHLLKLQGKLDEAEPYYREALEGRRRVLGDDHHDTLASINNMGSLLMALGQLAEAEPYHREALERKRRTLGDDHHDTLASINNMGYLLQTLGRLDEAEAYYREALEGKRRILGDDDRHTLISIDNMGSLLRLQGRLDEAEPYVRGALEGFRRVLGNDHPDTLTSINNMGYLLQAQGRPDEAEPYYREALEGRRRILGDDHPDTLTSINNMGSLLQAQGKLDEAEALLREGLRVSRSASGDRRAKIAAALSVLGSVLISKDSPEQAEPMLREALAIRQEILPADDWHVFDTMSLLGASLAGQGQYADAEPLMLEGYQNMDPPPVHASRKREALERLVKLYEAWGKPDEAARWRSMLDR